MKLLVVFNPKAHNSRSLKHMDELRSGFNARSIEAKFLITERPGHGMELVARADLSAFDAVVAAGGDGTLFEALNGLYAHPGAHRIPLGVVPMGTGNAFAREIGLLPGNPGPALDMLEAGHTRKVDVARVDTGDEHFYFVNIMGTGFVVDAGMAARKLKHLGRAAYTLGTLWQSFRLHSRSLVIDLDGRRLERKNVFVEISNSRYTGTHFLMAPDAVIDDGWLDITLLNDISRRRLWRLFPTIYGGGHVQFKEVETFRAKQVRILEPAGSMLAPDGEFRGRIPAEVLCLHRDLDLIC